MIKLTIGENQGNQRLDRFLKKYFPKATLSHIYKLIRKDIKVDGKRKSPETILMAGEELVIYISEEEAASLREEKKRSFAKKQFKIIFEDDNILIVDKPFGLLVHGDSREKKNHLANQVIDYLIAKGDYDPRTETTFAPSPANRIDRNTTGLVIFGKTAEALRELNRMFRERGALQKVYLTIAEGIIKEPLHLQGAMIKDQKKNMVRIQKDDSGQQSQQGRQSQQGQQSQQDLPKTKEMDTYVYPVMRTEGQSGAKAKGAYTLAEVSIKTGRTHQIRVQLAEAGHPIIGDVKYGGHRSNQVVKQKYQLTTQLLHAYKLSFLDCHEASPLAYLAGRQFICPLPERFESIKNDIFGQN